MLNKSWLVISPKAKLSPPSGPSKASDNLQMGKDS